MLTLPTISELRMTSDILKTELLLARLQGECFRSGEAFRAAAEVAAAGIKPMLGIDIVSFGRADGSKDSGEVGFWIDIATGY